MKGHTPSRAGSLPRLGWRDGRHDLRGEELTASHVVIRPTGGVSSVLYSVFRSVDAIWI